MAKPVDLKETTFFQQIFIVPQLSLTKEEKPNPLLENKIIDTNSRINSLYVLTFLFASLRTEHFLLLIILCLALEKNFFSFLNPILYSLKSLM